MKRKKVKSTFWFEYLIVSLVALAIGIMTATPRSPSTVMEHLPALKANQWILEKESIQYLIKVKMDDDSRNKGLDKGRKDS